MSIQAASDTVSNLALLPGFLDPVNLLNSFGNWMLGGLLLVVFIESGLLFPLLPGDSLLFTAGLLSAQENPFAPIWLLLILIPVAGFLGDQCGYFIGKKGGAKLFKDDNAKLFKKKYIDESHEFFEKYGPITIILARFVPIVRTYAPLVAGASRMRYPVFVSFNIIGAVLWGAGVTLLGYFLGNIAFIRDNIDVIFILIVLVSVLPIMSEVFKRFLAARRNRTPQVATVDASAPAAPSDTTS
ncbi:membrane-associated protein [Rhodococcus triatomae]|uniref:Membrane-associated protein n=1 Tax=Rhodococcus triatomae TaxID=300028 RepID=A0A1G8PHF9_9NOCA|nr:VTT domain-containing protein [Rhodococcus triatomae]SDI91913.1 membrane-associated protein [Rhodococcus triatomae]